MAKFLAAKAQVAADVIQHVFSRDKVPFRLRGSLGTKKVGYVSHVDVQSVHFPKRDMFGNLEPGTSLDSAVRDLVDGGHFIWDGVPPPESLCPRIYFLTHRSGIPTRVIAWQPKKR